MNITVFNFNFKPGWTVLMQSSHSNWIPMVEWLLSNGANPNFQMPATGWTAMHSAAKAANVEVLKLLLEKGGSKTLKAKHQSMGNNLLVEDCSTNADILSLLNQYPRTT